MKSKLIIGCMLLGALSAKAQVQPITAAEYKEKENTSFYTSTDPEINISDWKSTRLNSSHSSVSRMPSSA